MPELQHLCSFPSLSYTTERWVIVDEDGELYGYAESASACYAATVKEWTRLAAGTDMADALAFDIVKGSAVLAKITIEAVDKSAALRIIEALGG